jgi:hypothetical protein
VRPDGAREPGLTDVRTLPAALQAIARRDGFSWSWSTATVRTNLRGKKRDALLAWMRGERPSPRVDA